MKKSLPVSNPTVPLLHRLSTVRNCDRIYVLKNGHIMEQGDHSQLLERGGWYKTMWEQQSAADESGNGVTHAPELNSIELN